MQEFWQNFTHDQQTFLFTLLAIVAAIAFPFWAIGFANEVTEVLQDKRDAEIYNQEYRRTHYPYRY